MILPLQARPELATVFVDCDLSVVHLVQHKELIVGYKLYFECCRKSSGISLISLPKFVTLVVAFQPSTALTCLTNFLVSYFG